MSAVERIISGRKKSLGDDFTVARVLPYAKRRHVGPFVFFDEMGPATFKPGTGIDVRPHPHIGLSTVTYLFEGEMDHADTLGVQKTIHPGAVNLMTAGKGIAHSERTGPKARAEGHSIHGIQVWIALPKADEEIEPDFEHTPANKLPQFELGGATLRVILGSAYGHTSPVKVRSAMVYIHAEMPAGSAFDLPEGAGDLGAYVVSGSLETGGEPVGKGHMVVFQPGATATLRAREDSRVMVLGGADLGPRAIEWNFVSSSQKRFEKAKADWRASIAGGWKDTPFSMPPGENEYIPLPGDPDPGQ
jgi:redox-sensitive bicupin YhaK (pirin superfamily)